jgi:hypothetical protein
MPAYNLRLSTHAPMPYLRKPQKAGQAGPALMASERILAAAAQIRTVLPGYRHLSDAEVVELSFKLSDA